jgi:hypothetical protein
MAEWLRRVIRNHMGYARVGSNPTAVVRIHLYYIALRFCSVMVITLDFESNNPGSNPGRTFVYITYIHMPMSGLGLVGYDDCLTHSRSRVRFSEPVYIYVYLLCALRVMTHTHWFAHAL